MRHLLKLAIVTVAVLLSSDASAETYSLTEVKRIDQDLYSFRSGSVRGVVVTRYCYEYVYAADAILKWDSYSYDNKIIFLDGLGTPSCEVAKVMTR